MTTATKPAKQESKAVATKGLDEATTQALADMAPHMEGMINVRKEILQVARVKLVQKMSKAVDSGLGVAGEFVCDLRGVNFGKSLQIIPIMASESASLLYNSKFPPSKNAPMEARDGQVLCRSNDLIKNLNGVSCVACPFGEYWNEWSANGGMKIPGCKSSIDFVVMVPGYERPFEMNFRKNNMKAGKTLINMMFNDARGVPFASVYTLKPMSMTKDDYKFFSIDPVAIEKRALDNDELRDIIPVARHLSDLKKNKSLQYESQQSDADDDLPI